MYRVACIALNGKTRKARANNMKTEINLKTGFLAAAFLLISAAAVAQSVPADHTSHRTKPANQSSAIKPRDAHSGIATGRYQRKSGAIHNSDYNRNARKSGHEGERQSGENPLYESSYANTRTKAPAQGRPRQSDQAKGVPLKGVHIGAHGLSRQEAGAQSRKHPAGVKYQNRSAAKARSQTPSGTPEK